MKETDSVNGRPIFDMVKPMDVPSIGMTALEGNTYVSITGRPLHVVPDALFPTSAVTTPSAVYCDFGQFTIMGIREDVSVNEYKEYFGATGLGGTHQKGIEVVETSCVCIPCSVCYRHPQDINHLIGVYIVSRHFFIGTLQRSIRGTAYTAPCRAR